MALTYGGYTVVFVTGDILIPIRAGLPRHFPLTVTTPRGKFQSLPAEGVTTGRSPEKGYADTEPGESASVQRAASASHVATR